MTTQRWMVAATIGCTLLVAGVAIKSRDYLSGVRPAPDAGAYVAAGMVVNEGRALYRDVNHSAPGVAFLDAAALRLGGTTYASVRTMEVVFAVAGGWLALLVAFRLTRRLGLATVMALLFVMLASRNFLLEEGNVTEEFGMFFTLAGIAGSILIAQMRTVRNRYPYVALCGAAFGVAALCKEPFVFSCVAWLALIALTAPGDAARERRTTVLYSLFAMIAGALGVVVLFLLYLVTRGAFTAWADSIAIALHYAGLSRELMTFTQKHSIVARKFTSVLLSANWAAVAFAAIGVTGAVVAFIRARSWSLAAIATAATAGLLFDYYGASTSGRPYGHYFLQTLPSYFVLACCGAEIVARLAGSRRPWAGTVLVAAAILIDWRSTRAFARQLSYPHVNMRVGDVSAFVRGHAWPGDHLWSPSLYNSRFYIETGLTPSVSYAFVDPVLFQDTRFTTREERLERLASQLRSTSPEWMVLPNIVVKPLDEAGIMRWICANYTRLPHADEAHGALGILYARFDRVAALAQPAIPDSACIAALTQR